MKINHFSPFLFSFALLGLGLTARGQQYEAGGMALATAYKSTSVTAPGASGLVGFNPGFAGGAFFGQTITRHLGGEFRYIFADNTQTLTSGDTQATFSGRSHIFNYDLLLYPTRPDGRLRPYLAIGGGVKVYQGTGTEVQVQPLSNLALLTKASETVPAGDFGGGVKFRSSRNTMVRFEFRDYITKVPRVFTPGLNANISGIFHQWVPAFGFSYTF